ncbi:MAG: hypothetical protein ABMA00_02530 [Gemmatimonas sp.]
MRSPVLIVSLAIAAQMAMPFVLHAQGVRIRGVTSVRFLELRPFVDDSVAFSTTLPGMVDYRLLADGRAVRCGEGDAFCRFKRAGSTANALPLVQDLQMSAWGLGRGVSVHADLRVRNAMGSQPALWPRAEDAFDALTAYVELDRPQFTARAGRQYATSGLGFYNYDGAALVYRPYRRVTVEGFGGWSLAQGLNEQFTSSEIGAVDELPPDRKALLVGAQLRVRPTDRSSLSALYQREVRDNRSALYSERIAVDGTWRFGRSALDGSLQRDLSTSEFNELRARLRLPPRLNTVVSLEARHFRPFFELWTIWGAFAPAGFDEARLQASWRNTAQSLSFDVHGATRRWSDTDAGLDFDALRADGWRVGGNVTWQAATNWHTNAGYSADVGFGAARSEGDVGVHWQQGVVFLGATASAFQSIYELRIGTGRVFGFGLDAGWQINPDLRVVGDVSLYQQQARNSAPSTDWTQRRATARFEWVVGSDPGARTVSAATRKAEARARGEAELARLAAARTGRLPASTGAPEIRP